MTWVMAVHDDVTAESSVKKERDTATSERWGLEGTLNNGRSLIALCGRSYYYMW